MSANKPWIIRPQNKLDSQGSEELKKQFLSITYEPPRLWIIDMSHVEFIDSSGLGALVVAQKTAKKLGCRLVVCHLGDVAKMVLEITQLDRVFEIVDNIDEISANPQTLLSA
ncbi:MULTISPECIES: STAS domain-containing protein [Arthrospira]|jgi:anti-anti-sigma factor|uniref:Anti-sigma factor antagonist n=1 Tax=Limnospira platensis NIES-46 TaxID=1236695 RepID=A0A5M3T957_LIMPL|nr:STAS domain-containing protein [Arthrospira platensis]KDR57926.1 anti-sigma-factor antagonist [Arthrospira platensis str. Paraca]MBD2667536.1 STAS domain-containing protein [Arthrospira platensis FACHB-439]MBD2709711.1 STAS domain-containing protein [Arthrospira platensis FACHB-835]MDF2209041.1 STAS domain-containing protein [Arthrospira platensis NCB002]MDT9181156.1 STAS domain-containing protein [Limnospira sp. PMC 289.06]MDT9294836.1 STAS domain-containing protein [Arthrospira platensis